MLPRFILLVGAALLVWPTAGMADDAEAIRHAQRSYELSKAGDLDGAAAEMMAAITAAPQNPLFHTALGGIRSRQGKRAEAKASFLKAVELDPTNPVFRSQLALKQWETGDLENARDSLLLLVSRNEANSEALRMLEAVSLDWGAVLARQGRWKAGLRVAKDTAQRFTESAGAWQMLGLFETRNQENLAALESYRRALQLDAECVDCAIGLGVAQAAAGLGPEATRTFENALLRWPSHAVLRQATGVHLLRQADVHPDTREAAIRELSKALELDPQLMEARYQLGNHALQTGDVQGALSHLQAAASSRNPAAKVHYALSRAWRRAGDQQKAAEAMRRFQEQRINEQP